MKGEEKTLKRRTSTAGEERGDKREPANKRQQLRNN